VQLRRACVGGTARWAFPMRMVSARPPAGPLPTSRARGARRGWSRRSEMERPFAGRGAVGRLFNAVEPPSDAPAALTGGRGLDGRRRLLCLGKPATGWGLENLDIADSAGGSVVVTRVGSVIRSYGRRSTRRRRSTTDGAWRPPVDCGQEAADGRRGLVPRRPSADRRAPVGARGRVGPRPARRTIPTYRSGRRAPSGRTGPTSTGARGHLAAGSGRTRTQLTDEPKARALDPSAPTFGRCRC
jgi:hypothetical protein